MGNSSTNRWGLAIARGSYALAHHPRGGSVSGVITRVAIQPGYGKRVSLASGSTVGIDDVFKIEGFYVEQHEPKRWQSVFPSALAENSQTHKSIKDARSYIHSLYPDARIEVRRAA